MNSPQSLDKGRIKHAFGRAAATYDTAAVVQRYMIDELVSRFDVVKIEPRRILDVGCGTGYAAQGLRQRFPNAQLILLDIAPAMLSRARGNPSADCTLICGDGEFLPVAEHSMDVVFSNALLQWCDVGRVCTEFARVLKPGGLLSFASFGPDTLYELRRAWGQVDDKVHVHDFFDMHDIGDVLIQCQMANPVMDADYLTVTHKNFSDAMRDLKDLGANNASNRRSRGLTGKGKLAALKAAYEMQRNTEGLLETTYEIVYGHAWASTPHVRHETDGAVTIPLTEIK